MRLPGPKQLRGTKAMTAATGSCRCLLNRPQSQPDFQGDRLFALSTVPCQLLREHQGLTGRQSCQSEGWREGFFQGRSAGSIH